MNTRNVKTHLGVTVEPEVFDWIENERGMIKRATFVNALFKKVMETNIKV